MPDVTDLVLAGLPYLRRYARALTGSQARGDQHVRFLLETLLQEPGRLDPTSGVVLRLQMFRAFHDIFAAVSAVRQPDEGDLRADRLRHGLASLPAIERQVLLLVSLEGFGYEDVGYILKQGETEVRDHFYRARADMQRQTAAAILIIEDEQVIAMDIARIVQEMGHILCGTAAREREAIDLAEQTRPALVLADIQLKDGDSGIAAVQEILKKIDAPVIFVTGFPERLLTGKTLEPAFVITKPFKPDTLKAAISQALSLNPPQPIKLRRTS